MDRRGELGDPWEAAPRGVFVWEGLLARLPAERQAAEKRWIKLKRWHQAFRLWEWDIYARHVVHDVNWRLHWVTDVLVTHPEPFAALVRQYMDQSQYEYGRFFVNTLEEFEHQLTYMPEVTVVWHGDRSRPFLFGSKGRYLNAPGGAFSLG